MNWLNEYNLLEEKDEEILQNIEREVLDKGGKDFLLVTEDEKLAGTVGILPHTNDTIEIIKLSVDKEYRGFGFGKKLMIKAIDEALHLGYKEIILYTFSGLKTAISIYEKLGFIEEKLDNSGYDVVDIKMIYKGEKYGTAE